MLRYASNSTFKLVRPRHYAGYRVKAFTETLGHKENALLVDYLRRLQTARPEVTGRSQAFVTAIDRICALKVPIRTVEDLKHLPRLNPQIKSTVEAWLAGADYVGTAALMKDSQEIMKVPSIGPLRAAELVRAGARTIADLRNPEFYRTLTQVQRTFLDFYDTLQVPSDLQTAQLVRDAVQGALKPTIDVVIVGDHRRGLEISSSTQLLVINSAHEHIPTPASTGSVAYYSVAKNEATQGNLTQETVELLTRRGICAAELRFTTHKWTGMVRIPEQNDAGEWETMAERLKGVQERKGRFKRADICFVPAKSRGAALITTTGDDGVISHVRKKAEELGLHFNEFGLWRFHPSEKSPKHGRKQPSTSWELLPCETEEEIFAELGLDWIEPADRTSGNWQSEGVPKNRKKY